MNYQKIITDLEHHASEASEFLASYPDPDEMESEKAAHRAMVCAVHALRELTQERAAHLEATMLTRSSRLYLSGPMTGLPQQNYPAFHAAAASLRRAGYRVVNPAELHPHSRLRRWQATMTAWLTRTPAPALPTWGEYMRAALVGLLSCEAIVLLPGWEHSRGARCEVSLAAELGMRRCTIAEALSANKQVSNAPQSVPPTH